MQQEDISTSTTITTTTTLPTTTTATVSSNMSKQQQVNGNTHAHTANGNIANGKGEGRVDEDGQSLEKLMRVSVIVLRQAVDLVNTSLTEDGQLSYVSKYIPGSTIGKHLRHARDHFSLLLDSIDPQTGNVINELCYDVRSRGTPMETSRAAAREALEECVERLEGLVPKTKKDEVVVLNAVTPHMQTFRTSFGRELWFGALHAVHHWSMVRVIAGELGIELEESFGVAPSTLVYRGTECALGKSKI